MSNTDDRNLYEESARNAKVGLLAGFMVGSYANMGALWQAPAAVATISDERWNQAAFLLGINPPSEETIAAARADVSRIVQAISDATD